MPYKTFDQQVKRTSVWLAPTGIPLIAGAAGCAGRGILMTGCFFLSMFFAFCGAPNWAKPFKESGDHWSETLFEDWNYGWERTVEFAKILLGVDPVQETKQPVQETKQKYIDKSAPEIKGKKKEIEINEVTLDDIAIKTDNTALSQVTAEQVAYNSEREKSGDQQT